MLCSFGTRIDTKLALPDCGGGGGREEQGEDDRAEEEEKGTEEEGWGGGRASEQRGYKRMRTGHAGGGGRWQRWQQAPVALATVVANCIIN